VIDKDLATELLARQLDADVYVMATDVEGVFTGWGTAAQALLRRATPGELAAMDFAAGSMGPKVTAACEFVEATGRRAAIGSLEQIEGLVAGTAGTAIVPKEA
jgi:carbamate kinase